ncbi:hypothetical protein JW933_08720, partial [candidate division FCPU426 bacterium]|nr:hypothetical protein [candidate division FCPU426 bacterium]
MRIYGGILLAAIILAGWSSEVLAATLLYVTSTADAGGNTYTLRGAIETLNANANPGETDIIQFTLGTNNVITIGSGLPQIVESVQIDGGNGGNYVKLIGGGPLGYNCFNINVTNNGSVTISNLSIVNFNQAVRIQSNACYVNHCWLGTDWTNNISSGPNNYGIYAQSVSNCSFGGSGGTFRNIVAHNQTAGISLDSCTSISIWGSYFGTNNAGTAALGMQTVGVNLYNSANCVVGGTRSGQNYNVLSGNTVGVRLQGEMCANNIVSGNIIGLSADQLSAVPNTESGIHLLEGASFNIIGITSSTGGNIIAGNGNGSGTDAGILFSGTAPPYANSVQNNYIGLNQYDTAFSNYYGVYILQGASNLIGGFRDETQGNVISGNYHASLLSGGIRCQGQGNTISGNYIGTNIAGAGAVPNYQGILLAGSGNVIGVTETDRITQRNVISGNSQYGIRVTDGQGNSITGNYIGLTADGGSGLANGNNAVEITNLPSGTLLGGMHDNFRNVIAGSSTNRYSILCASASNNMILNNYVDCNAAGTVSDATFQNAESLRLNNSTGTNPAYGNLIANNVFCTEVALTDAHGNTLIGNRIGVLPNGIPVAFASPYPAGVAIWNGSHDNKLGLAGGQGNMVAADRFQSCVQVSGSGTVNNGIFGNTLTAFNLLPVNLQTGGNNTYAAPVVSSGSAENGLTITANAATDYVEVFMAGARYDGTR